MKPWKPKKKLKIFEDKKKRGYSNGSHSEIEVSKETERNADKIYERGMKLLHFMEERWNFHFASENQMENLLHIGFVKDGRPVPEEITEEKTDKAFSDIDTGETRHTQRKAYWTYALPILREAHGGNGPYKNVNPSTNDYLDGFFRILSHYEHDGNTELQVPQTLNLREFHSTVTTTNIKEHNHRNTSQQIGSTNRGAIVHRDLKGRQRVANN